MVGFSERSGRVISTCESCFREDDLGSGESLEDVDGALAERTPPGSRPVQGRCLGCWRRLVEQKTAERQQVFSVAGQPAENRGCAGSLCVIHAAGSAAETLGRKSFTLC